MFRNVSTRLDIRRSLSGEDDLPVIIAGPCVIESETHAMKMAEIVRSIVDNQGFKFIFKSSYDKANRSSIHSFRGPGLQEGLRILEKIKDETGVPILTDIHSVDQISVVAGVVDVIQIPAFLCRQTDFYIEAGRHDIAVNVKKGQFMSPDSMKNVVEKARECNIQCLTITERGTSFGYERLVVDFTGLMSMRQLGVPLIFDGTHAVQQPGGGGDHTIGNRDYVPGLCRAASAIGVDGFFLEVHDCPDCAPCDGPNMITPDTLSRLLREIYAVISAVKESDNE